MKSIQALLLLFTLLINFSAFSQKDNLKCKSKIDISKDSSRIASDKIMVTSISKFKLRISLVVISSEPYLLVESLSTGVPNRKVNLGEEISLTIHFANGDDKVITFDSPQKQGGIDYPHEVVYNEFKIERELLEKLSKDSIIKVSALYPYGKLSKVTSMEQKLTKSIQDRIIVVATCMLRKIDELNLELQ